MIPLLIFPYLGFVLLPSDLPRVFTQEIFNSRDLALAVNWFVAMREERANKSLADLASDFLLNWERGQRTNFSLNSRISWMCRILYEPKGSEPLRQPAFGELSMPRLTMPLARWPLCPLALSGDTYFVLSDHYLLGGQPESMIDYLNYCKTEGNFRKKPVPVPHRKQALKDFAQLTQSEKWKAIKWKDSASGESYYISEEWILKGIKAQAEGIPEK